MKCPICHDKKHVEIDLHGDGYSSGTVKECGSCGAVWSKTDTEVSMISIPKMKYVEEEYPTTEFTHTTEEHTKYSCCEDEYVAEEEQVWFA